MSIEALTRRHTWDRSATTIDPLAGGRGGYTRRQQPQHLISQRLIVPGSLGTA